MKTTATKLLGILLALGTLLLPLETHAFTNSALFVLSSSQYASRVSAAAMNITGDLTFETWYKPSSQPSGTNDTYSLLWKWATGQGQYGFNYNDGGGFGRLYGVLYDSGAPSTNVNYLLNQTLTTGTWYHLAFVWVASTHTMTFYVNGTSVGSVTDASVSTLNTNTGTLTIGAGTGGSSRYNDGRMFMTRLWSVARTQPQIAANECTALGATANLVGEWTLDNTLNDDSGNGFTLTNNNTFTFPADIPATCVSVVSPVKVPDIIWWGWSSLGL